MKFISDAALLYALRELSRRAGVSLEFFSQWQITQTEEGLVVRPEHSRRRSIVFPLSRSGEHGLGRVVRKGWGELGGAKGSSPVADFVVPFSIGNAVDGEPLFVAHGAEQYRCTEDLLTSILLTLCRAEEREAKLTDLHGRFRASEGIAARNGFLNRPIVDEYGLVFQRVLQAQVPGWTPPLKAVRVKLSHDIDEIGIPFSFRSAVGHIVLRRSLWSGVRDFLSVANDADPGYLDAVERICGLGLERGLRPALYWQSAGTTPFDTGYELHHPKIVRLIRWAMERGLEQGVHPGYKTFRSRVLLQEEVQRIKTALGREKLGGRQHYLRWCPETWSDWESCGLAYDSSVGFVDQAGFRCGTCVPYLPWLLEADRCADLIEIPLIASDGTLVNHMGLGVEASREVVQDLLEKCRNAGGVFTLLWHNTGIFPPCRDHYLPLLELISGEQDYEWESDLNQLRQERHILAEKTASLRRESRVASAR